MPKLIQNLRTYVKRITFLTNFPYTSFNISLSMLQCINPICYRFDFLNEKLNYMNKEQLFTCLANYLLFTNCLISQAFCEQ